MPRGRTEDGSLRSQMQGVMSVSTAADSSLGQHGTQEPAHSW